MSMHYVVLGTLSTRLLLTPLQNGNFTGSANTKLYPYKNFNLNHFVMHVNVRQAPSEGLSLNRPMPRRVP